MLLYILCSIVSNSISLSPTKISVASWQYMSGIFLVVILGQLPPTMHPYLKTKVEDVICKGSMRCSVEADAPQWCAKQCCLHPARLPLGRSAAAAGLHGNGMFRVELTSDESALPNILPRTSVPHGQGSHEAVLAYTNVLWSGTSISTGKLMR